MAGPDEEVLLSGEQERERESSPQAWEGRSHGLQGRAALAKLVGHELGHDFGVGFGSKRTCACSSSRFSSRKFSMMPL